MTVPVEHRPPDRVTRWWRGVSLRAKVTAVTVAVLVLGLVAAGFGTLVFLRTTLVANLDTTLSQLAQGSIAANALLETTLTSEGPVFSVRENAAPTEYWVAIYDAGGGRVITAGGQDSRTRPVFPDTFRLDEAYARPLSPFELPGDPSGAYRAMVIVTQVEGASALYTQMVAVPTTPTERVIATYLSIYTLLALATVAASAFLVRWVVTLTFRSLTQVERTAETIAAGDFSQRLTDIEPDTTEVGRLKRAINAMLGRVDAAIRQRDATVRQMRRFIGDASHELRTPLVTVRGYAELYRMGAIPDAAGTAQAMERIEKEAVRMASMVEDLLALARLDERRDIMLRPVDLRPIARDAALDVTAAAPRRSVTVVDAVGPELPVAWEAAVGSASDAQPEREKRRPATATGAIALAGATLSRLRRRPRHRAEDAITDLEPTLAGPAPTAAPIVLGDENRIRQVVANLLGNAQRFSPPDSPIEVRVGVDETTATGWIDVVDHGEGVPEQIRERIFERFWRADTSRARHTGGSGLGLSIVAAVVEALHGTVAVHDTPGGGATFRVALPLAPDAAESPASPTTEDGPDDAEVATAP